jgi:hypothetical protein
VRPDNDGYAAAAAGTVAAAENSEGAGALASLALQAATRKANTPLCCFRAVRATVITRSAKRCPRALWAPKQRFRHKTKARSSCSPWLCRVQDYAALTLGRPAHK